MQFILMSTLLENILSMDVFFPAFLELPGSDTLPVPEVNFPGPRPILEARERPPSFRRKLLDRGPRAMFLMINQLSKQSQNEPKEF